MKKVYSILLIVLITCSCSIDSKKENIITSTPEEKDPVGYLYYNSDINVLSRHQKIDGGFISGAVSLSYYSTPGAHDGDGGTDFVFKILNEEILSTQNQWIEFSTGDLEAYYIQWASPAGYDWQACDSMPGQFRILEYTELKSLVLELDFVNTESVTVKFFK